MSFMTLVEGSDGKEITQKRLQLEYQLAQSRNQKRVAAGILGGTAKALKYKKSGHNNASGNGITSPHNTNSNIIKDSFNSELRQETRWVSTKRIGSRLFKVGEMAPAYDGQPPDRWKTLRPEDCK